MSKVEIEKKIKPTKVKVLHKIYTIKYDKSLCDAHYLKSDTKVYAFIDYVAMNIIVDHTLPVLQQKECLLHEMQHAAFEIVQLAIDNPDEEQFVTIGTPILFDTLRDPVNKDVFDFLFG